LGAPPDALALSPATGTVPGGISRGPAAVPVVLDVTDADWLLLGATVSGSGEETGTPKAGADASFVSSLV
jgi:hypothetical protein